MLHQIKKSEAQELHIDNKGDVTLTVDGERYGGYEYDHNGIEMIEYDDLKCGLCYDPHDPEPDCPECGGTGEKEYL